MELLREEPNKNLNRWKKKKLLNRDNSKLLLLSHKDGELKYVANLNTLCRKKKMMARMLLILNVVKLFDCLIFYH